MSAFASAARTAPTACGVGGISVTTLPLRILSLMLYTEGDDEVATRDGLVAAAAGVAALAPTVRSLDLRWGVAAIAKVPAETVVLTVRAEG